MSRGEATCELHGIIARLPEMWVAVLLYIARRLDSGAWSGATKDGTHITAQVLAEKRCDLAVDTIAQFLKEGPGAACSPARGISARRAGC